MQALKKASRYFISASRDYFKRYYIFLLLFLGLAIFFRFNSNIDVYISSLFYSGENYFQKNIITNFAYSSVHYVSYCLIIILSIALLLSLFTKIRLFNLSRRAVIYLSVSFLFINVLFVDVLAKPFVGRARPVDSECFGGANKHTSPFQLGSECSYNCSFPSGHASLAFSLYAFTFLLKARRREIAFAIISLYGIIVSLGRIMEGRHFFTDTLFAALFAYFFASFIYALFYYDK